MRKFNIGWGITSCCNMNCNFCYSKNTRKKIKKTNLELNDWKKFIDENFMFIDSINYGTGENTINDEFFEFIKYVRKKYPNIKQALTTNGYLSERISNNKHLYKIYKECLDEVDVSLDFCEKEKHNQFRGQNKAYDWAIKTLEFLKKDNKKATIVFVAFEETVDKKNIDGLFKIAKKYNAILRLNIYRPTNPSKEINDKFTLKYKSAIETIEYIMKKYSVLSINDALFGNIYLCGVDIYDNTGTESIRILPDGSICPSTYLITKKFSNKYNIKQSNVLSHIDFEDFSNPVIPKNCKNCFLVNKCRGGVLDRRILWYGTLKKRDPYCPYDNNDDIIKKRVKIKKISRISVHDGYLPTMFFSNKGGKTNE